MWCMSFDPFHTTPEYHMCPSNVHANNQILTVSIKYKLSQNCVRMSEILMWGNLKTSIFVERPFLKTSIFPYELVLNACTCNVAITMGKRSWSCHNAHQSPKKPESAVALFNPKKFYCNRLQMIMFFCEIMSVFSCLLCPLLTLKFLNFLGIGDQVRYLELELRHVLLFLVRTMTRWLHVLSI